MKKKIVIFKNDSIGDLVHSVPAINDIIKQHQNHELIIFLSNISKDFYFLFQKTNTRLKILNYNLNLIQKIKIFIYLLINNVDKVYILAPKNFYFYLPMFFFKIKFFGLCVNSRVNKKRPSLFLRKFLYKFIVNDRETRNRRKSTQLLQLNLVSEKKDYDISLDYSSDIKKSKILQKYLPSDYILIHYKKKFFEELNWGVDGLDLILNELKKYASNIVLTKDIELDKNNEIFKNRYNAYDFKTDTFYDKKSKILFLDNIKGINLYNTVKHSRKIVAIHGIITNLGFLCKKPVLDLFLCRIKNRDDFYSCRNAFFEFKPNYQGYDFILPGKNLNKTIKKMKFVLNNNK